MRFMGDSDIDRIRAGGVKFGKQRESRLATRGRRSLQKFVWC
jgi:hypothetical protein